jgi:hypothetical protein
MNSYFTGTAVTISSVIEQAISVLVKNSIGKRKTSCKTTAISERRLAGL